MQPICQNFPGVHQETFASLGEACQGANALYVTRVQRERFESAEAYERVKVSVFRR